jgi:hypothetical protein
MKLLPLDDYNLAIPKLKEVAINNLFARSVVEKHVDGRESGLLKAKSAIVFNTSNTGTDREKKVFGDPLETIWKNREKSG